jgi:hypothetical protein
MKRRTLIASLGSLTVGSVFAVGSGAFTSVSAERSVKVETENDNDARLALEELGEGGRSEEDGGVVTFSFPSDDERLADEDLGLGVDSEYEFDRDTDESGKTNPTEGLLQITNQGTQSVEVYSQHQTSSEIEIELYDVTDTDRTALRNEPAELSTGDSINVGFRIRTFGVEVDTTSDETLTIVAEAP